MQDSDLSEHRPVEPPRFNSIGDDTACRASLLGSKYEMSGSRLLESSVRLDWRPGLAAELRRHSDMDCAAFFQPVNEVAITIRGSALVRRKANGPEQLYVSNPGLACVCPRGVDVRYLRVAGGSTDLLHLYLPPDLFGLLDIQNDEVCDVGLSYMAGVEDPLITQIGQTIAQLLVTDSTTRASSVMAESLGIALTAHLVESYSRTGKAHDALEKCFNQVRGGLDSRRLKRVVDFVHANADTNISLEAMAREACLSRFHFVRAFRQSMGQTPLAYVTGTRILRAKELLLQTPSTIEDIALALNFSSGSNFVRTFKREVGQTPSAYRTALVPRRKR